MKTENLTIFVVDDSPFALATIKRAIQHPLNCHVEAFASAEACIHKTYEHPPDLILSDYFLDSQNENKINGDRMLAHIKTKYPSIPVIMYSSHNSLELFMKLMKLGAADVIPKEKNFIQTISDITFRQIRQIKHDHETKVTSRNFLLFIAVAIGLWTIAGLFMPGLMVYFFFGLLAWIIVWAAIIGNKKEKISKQSQDMHKISSYEQAE